MYSEIRTKRISAATKVSSHYIRGKAELGSYRVCLVILSFQSLLKLAALETEDIAIKNSIQPLTRSLWLLINT